MSLSNVKLDALVYDYVKGLPPKEINHISPSQLGGCMRKHYLAIKHVPQTTPPSPGALVNFQLGFLFEELFTKALASSEVTFKDQQPLKDEALNVEGTCDFLLYDKETDAYEVIDTKTESAMAATYRKRSKQTFLESHPEYEIQIGTYMLMLKRMGKNVERGRFVVVVKDNGMMSEHFVALTPHLEAKILDRIERLNGYLRRNELPPCECEGWQIGYCGYGNPYTQVRNSTGKVVNSECCSADLIKGGK